MTGGRIPLLGALDTVVPGVFIRVRVVMTLSSTHDTVQVYRRLKEKFLKALKSLIRQLKALKGALRSL